MSEKHTQLYRRFFNTDPPKQVVIGKSQADILSTGRGFMSGFDLTMQLQVGCPAGCLFCYVSRAHMLAPTSIRGADGERWGYEIRNKVNPAKKLKRHLQKDTLRDKTVYWSGVTDPYATAPHTTRTIWESLIQTPAEKRPRRIAIQTRFRPDRDAALIAQYADETKPADGGPAVVVSYSVGTDRDDLIRAWERATPLFEQRMRCIERLRASGLFVVATLSPFGLWNDLRGTLQRLDDLGVAYVTVLFFKIGTASANTPRPFQEYLQEKYPCVLDPAWQAERLAEARDVLGSRRVLVGKTGFESLSSPHNVVSSPAA